MLSPKELLLLGYVDAVRDSGGHPEDLERLYRYAHHVREDGQVPDPMPAGWNRPAPATLVQLVGVLRDALEAVELGDSYEGFIQWTMPTDERELALAEFGLIARYRIGNLNGQGGMQVFQP